ncbi:MAG: hypothetical protein ACXVFQ_17400 [Solirubrobacteraceae bacterium]
MGADLTWKRSRALSTEWEHEHCEFCFHKFMDPESSPHAAEALRNEPDKQSDAGYTNVEAPDRPAGKWWICKQCFADFAEELGWTVVDSDPDAWPYDGPAPEHRPTATDHDKSRWIQDPTESWLERPE